MVIEDIINNYRGRVCQAFVYGAFMIYSFGCAAEPVNFKPESIPVSEDNNPRITRRVIIGPGDAKDSIGKRLDIAMQYCDPNEIRSVIEGLKD